MGVADCGDLAGVSGGSEPIGNRRTDNAATGGRQARIIARRFAGDKQDYPGALCGCHAERPVKQRVGAGGAVAVEVYRPIGVDSALGEALVPIAV